MNYKDMSDFEINKLVAEILNLNLCDGQHYKPDASYWKNGTCTMFNPCNNPSDAWPIIIENEISLDPRRTIKKIPWMACYSDQVYATDKNPLRAAMICFLKMKDAEK